MFSIITFLLYFVYFASFSLYCIVSFLYFNAKSTCSNLQRWWLLLLLALLPLLLNWLHPDVDDVLHVIIKVRLVLLSHTAPMVGVFCCCFVEYWWSGWCSGCGSVEKNGAGINGKGKKWHRIKWHRKRWHRIKMGQQNLAQRKCHWIERHIT